MARTWGPRSMVEMSTSSMNLSYGRKLGALIDANPEETQSIVAIVSRDAHSSRKPKGKACCRIGRIRTKISAAFLDLCI
jgi:hypothetical protein